MTSTFNIGFIFDAIKLALYIASAYVAFQVYAHQRQSAWALSAKKKNFLVLTLLTLLIVGIKIFEDVIAKESGSFDLSVLWFIRQKISADWRGFFEVTTWSGAAKFLIPTSAVLCSVLFLRLHRRAAVLLASSMITAWTLTYILKATVRRPRPELWDTSWYWGSSFPSGHTLNTASFAIASACIAAGLWPKSRMTVFMLAMVWISLVGLSRLVLGVHWPTDVLAAVCLGMFIPLALSMFLDHNLQRL